MYQVLKPVSIMMFLTLFWFCQLTKFITKMECRTSGSQWFTDWRFRMYYLYFSFVYTHCRNLKPRCSLTSEQQINRNWWFSSYLCKMDLLSVLAWHRTPLISFIFVAPDPSLRADTAYKHSNGWGLYSGKIGPWFNHMKANHVPVKINIARVFSLSGF